MLRHTAGPACSAAPLGANISLPVTDSQCHPALGCLLTTMKTPKPALFPFLPHLSPSGCLHFPPSQRCSRQIEHHLPTSPAHMEAWVQSCWPVLFLPIPPAPESMELVCQFLYSGFSQKTAFSGELQPARKCSQSKENATELIMGLC